MAEIDLNKYVTGGENIIEAAKSVRGLKSAVTQLSKGLEDDGKRIEAGFGKIAAAITAIQGKGGNLNLTNDGEKKQLQDLIRELDSLKLAKEAQKQADRDRIATQKILGDATTTFTKQLRDQREAFAAAYKSGDTDGAKAAALNIQSLTQQSNQLAKAVRGTASEFTAAKGSYNAASQELASLRTELRSIGGGLDAAGKGFDTANPRVAELNKRISQLDGQLKSADKSIGQSYRNVGNYADSIIEAVRALEQEKTALTASNTALTAQARVTGLTAEQQNKLQQEIKETDAQLSKVNKSLAGYGVGVANTGGTVKEFVGDLKGQATALAGSYIGLQAILGAAQSVFNNLVEFSDQAADVRKTTGLTADEFDNLADSLKQLNTRTSLAGLLDIAKVGGQLGIAKGDILDFTKAIDVAVQALGDDFSGGAEEIATSLGKLNTVFGKELGPDVAKNLLNIGSAVNELGAAGAATAPFLVDVAQRVGAVAAQTKIGLNNVLSYAAVLEETGFSAERSGTALNRLFSTISTKTDASFKIAKLADSNLTLKEFTKLVNTDFNQAIQLFLKGLNAGGKTTTELNSLLGTLKLQSGEAKNVIVTLAQNTQLFAERQKIANEQLADGNSLATEAAIKNDNLAGSFNRFKNTISNFFTSGTGASVIKFFVDLKNAEADAAGRLLDKIGEGITAIGQKVGIAKKPQEDYTVAVVKTTQALRDQTVAQQKTLDGYSVLASAQNRTAQQDLQLAQARATVIQQFGTDEVKQIQATIDKRKQQVEANKQGLRDQLSLYSGYVEQAQKEAALAQEGLNKVQKQAKLTADEVQRVKTAAAARIDSPNVAPGRSLIPQSQIDAATRLVKAERDLAEQQRIRINIANALRKVEDKPLVKPQVADTDTDAVAEETDALNKAAKARALARKQDLENQLADQAAIIKETKKFQAEQFQLLQDNQITTEIYKQAVGGTTDTIVAAIRQAGELKIKIAKQEQLASDADAKEALQRVLNNEKSSYAQRQDAQGEYFAKVQQDARVFQGKLAQIVRETQEQLQEEIKPINFVFAVIDKDKFLKGQKDIAGSTEQLMKDLNKRVKQLNDEAVKNQEDAEAKRLKAVEDYKRKREQIEEEILSFSQTAVQAFFDFRSQKDQARIDFLQTQKDKEVQIAGDNATLRAQIEANYDKKIRDAKKKAFKNDQQAAVAQVAIQTAIAIAKSIAQFPETFGLPFSAFALANGLLQAALIKSQPMPQYFKGRQDGPAEFAMVAERGPELITGKSGGARLIDKPSITYLRQGEAVHTAEKTREILRTAEIQKTSPIAVTVSFQQATKALQNNQQSTFSPEEWKQLMATLQATVAGTNKIVQAIKNQKTKTWDISPQGIVEVTKQAGSLTREMRGRLDRLGLK